MKNGARNQLEGGFIEVRPGVATTRARVKITGVGGAQG